MTAACKTNYTEWYHIHFATPPTNPKMRGYYNRKRIHVVKIAMLLSLARNDSLILDTADLDEAMEVLKHTEPAIEQALSGVGSNILSGPATTILEQVKSSKDGEIELGNLFILNSHNLDTIQFQEVLKSLQLQRKIETHFDSDSKITKVRYTGGSK